MSVTSWLSLSLALFCLITPPAVGAPADPLQQKAIALNSDKDLTALIDKAGQRHLVLLGEASHGTSEFYTWRRAISQRLIEEQNFRLIVVEGDWVSSYRLNRYVRGELPDSSAREILQGFTRWPVWMWANEETEELIEWLREYNRERPAQEQVGFYGMDVYGADEALTEIPELIGQTDSKLKRKVKQDYRCLQGGFERYVQRLQQRHSSCETSVDKVVAAISEHKKLKQQLSPNDYFYLLQSAKVVQHAERHYRAMLAQNSDSWNIRADHFYNTVVRLQEHYGDNNKAIVWAHNTHIGDARATSMAAQGQRNIGQLARQEQGSDQVFALGFGTLYGQVMAGSRWGATPEIMTVPKSPENSLEARLAAVDMPAFMLLFDDSENFSSLQQPIGHRAIGVVYNPAIEHRGNYVNTLPLRRYDGFIFIEKTHALTPVTH